ncbi:MAG: uncharacterized protein QOD06_384 [Candidatus Binatota bacterium]|jgi:Lon protease-like protein|nr:uncharacterized protein [Candidatus Binatota bacterium]
MSLPSLLPLFPLPNVVLFPQVLLPLHIFEPRYRQMVRDVGTGDGLIGMTLLRGGGEDPTGMVPDMYAVGCAGRMTRKIDLPDGRSHILLQGVREFVVREQTFDRPYRFGAVEWYPRRPAGERLSEALRRTLVERTRSFVEEQTETRILDDPTLCDEMLVNLLAFSLDLPVAEKQGLLEIRGLEERAARLVETVEFHLLERECVPSAEIKLRVQ